jgi:hypothetical protein
MDIKFKGHIVSTTLGEFSAGDVLKDVDPFIGEQYIARGVAEEYLTKVVRNKPTVGDIPLTNGPDKESLSSQAVPASPKKTRKSSKTKKQ